MTDRAEVRRLLYLWGATTKYCADKHRQLDEYSELIKSATSLQAAAVTGQPHGTAVGDPTPRQAEKLMLLEARYAERVDDLWGDIGRRLAIAHSVEEAMGDLNPVEHAVIKYRYEFVYGFKKIGELTQYSEDRAKHIECRAVDKIAHRIVIEPKVDTF